MEYLLTFAGLVLLFAGGNYLVDGAVDIANRFKVSPLIVGMTIVAFGTSAPEFIVSLQSAITGHPEISLGNVIGSNIANIGLILGLTALILPLAVQKVSFIRDMPFLLMISVILYAVMKDGEVSRYEGLMFILLIICHTLFCLSQTPKPDKEKIQEPKYNLLVAIIITGVAIAALAFGSDMLIDGASGIARQFGISERVIGITVVAFGTSVPELITSVIAAAKKDADIAIGNIIGSNIFNILFVLGTAAAIHPIANYSFAVFQSDLIWMIGFTLMLLLGIFPLRRTIFKKEYPDSRYSSLGRVSGFILLAGYITYVVLLF